MTTYDMPDDTAYPDLPVLHFTIPGVGAPKGSMRHVGHGRMVEQVKRSKPWRQAAAAAAREAVTAQHWPGPYTGAVLVAVTFGLPRPKSAPKTRTRPIVRGLDLDKGARNLLDSLVDAGVIGDDSQVVALDAFKRYTDEPHTVVRVEVLP